MSTPASVNGKLVLPDGTPPPAGTFVQLDLKNIGTAQPTVDGVAIYNQKQFTLSTVDGSWSGSLYRNDNISCNGVFNSVWAMTYFSGGRAVYPAKLIALAQASADLDTLPAINLGASTLAVPTPATGAESALAQFPNPASTWTCVHNFGTQAVHPTFYDLSWNEILPDTAVSTDVNTFTATFLEPQAGFMVVVNVGNWTPSITSPNYLISNPTSSQSIIGDFPLTIGGSLLARRMAGVRIVDTANTAGWIGSDVGAWINAAVADAGGKGKVYVAAGQYVFSTPITLDNLTSFTLEGASGALNGGSAAGTQLTFTGASGPIITAKSSTAVRITNLQIFWNNAAFTGDVFNSDHSALAFDTTGLQIDRCSFFKSGSGALATNVLNLNKTISSKIGPLNNFTSAAVAILGANVTGDYANVIHIHDNHFSSSTGSISTCMIRNICSGEVNSNTFEMGSAVGSPTVWDTTVQVNVSLDFHGNWIGDVGTTYTGAFMKFTGNGAGTGAEGVSVRANLWGGNNGGSSSVTGFNINNGGNGGIDISANFFQGAFTTFMVATAVGAVRVVGNWISGTGTTTFLSLSGTVTRLVVKDNVWAGNPTTFLSGTPTSGYLVDSAANYTAYGIEYTTLHGVYTFSDGVAVGAGNFTSNGGALSGTFTGSPTFSGNPTFSSKVTISNEVLLAAAPTVSAGQVGLGSTTATSATAGANGAVPAQVVGYLIINVAGTNVKVPYFAV